MIAFLQGNQMAKRRRKRATNSGTGHPKLPKAAETIGFTEAEEAFFRVADEPDKLANVADAPAPERPSLWRRLFLLAPDVSAE